MNIYPEATGIKLIRKPGKIYLNNTNLLNAINGSLKREGGIGGARETFFANQVSSLHKVTLHPQTDFLIDEQVSIEVGGKSKDFAQVKGLEDAFLAIDDTPIGYKNKIPLYLFGFLY